MLRVSSQVEGAEVKLDGIVEGDSVESGIPFEKEMLNFAEVALGEDQEVIAEARNALSECVGEAATVDTAAVIANFQRMVRIADGTGIPLDAPVAMMTQDIRRDLGLNEFGSADNTPPLAWYQKIMGRILKPVLPKLLSYMTREITGSR